MEGFERYTPQLALPEIGITGQQKLARAKVLVIGAGGLGNPLCASLTGSGIGHLGIADGDVVAITNLHRQFLFSAGDVGKNKATVIREKLALQNPAITLAEFPFFLTKENAREIISGYDIICDCTDNGEARILADSVCAELNKPLVYAAVSGWEGYITVLHYHKKITLSQVFPVENISDLNCAITGIAPPVCGIAASIQAGEVLKILLEQEGVLDGKILCFNALVNTYKTLTLFYQNK